MRAVRGRVMGQSLVCRRAPTGGTVLRRGYNKAFRTMLAKGKSAGYLVPRMKALRFLFHNRNRRCVPYSPSLCHNGPASMRIFIREVHLIIFQHLLTSRPMIRRFF